MENDFVALEGKSRGYYLVVALLVVVMLAGMTCFGLAYFTGHQVFGSSNAIPWGLPIVLAIYLIGLSAGSLILSSLTYVFGREEYKPIARIAVYLAVVLIFGAMISIAVDLGRPESVAKCTRVWTHLNVRADGGVAPCCYEFYKQDDFANIFETPFRQFWNNTMFITAREILSKGLDKAPKSPYTICHGCVAKGIRPSFEKVE